MSHVLCVMSYVLCVMWCKQAPLLARRLCHTRSSGCMLPPSPSRAFFSPKPKLKSSSVASLSLLSLVSLVTSLSHQCCLAVISALPLLSCLPSLFSLSLLPLCPFSGLVAVSWHHCSRHGTHGNTPECDTWKHTRLCVMETHETHTYICLRCAGARLVGRCNMIDDMQHDR
jgi:hypothetical protein